MKKIKSKNYIYFYFSYILYKIFKIKLEIYSQFSHPLVNSLNFSSTLYKDTENAWEMPQKPILVESGSTKWTKEMPHMILLTFIRHFSFWFLIVWHVNLIVDKCGAYMHRIRLLKSSKRLKNCIRALKNVCKGNVVIV